MSGLFHRLFDLNAALAALGYIPLRRMAWGDRPTAPKLHSKYRFTDAGPDGSEFFWNGTRYKAVNGDAMLKGQGGVITGIGSTEQIVCQAVLPIAIWQINDTLSCSFAVTKSGNTDNMLLNVRIGTTGTLADQSMGIASLAASTRSIDTSINLKLVTATSVQKCGPPGPSYGTNATAAGLAAVPIPDATANALYVSATVTVVGSVDTVISHSSRIQLLTP